MKKKEKNVIVYDFRGLNTIEDCYEIVAFTKFILTDDLTLTEKIVLKNMYCNEGEIIRDTISEAANFAIDLFGNFIEPNRNNTKKPNVFKRFWNRITRKK